MKIRTLNEYLKEQFGTKVYKLSLSSGTTCPNRDGTSGTGGCVFCSQGGSGDFAAPFEPLELQIQKAKLKVDKKFPSDIAPENRKYIAYFQSYTATYGDQTRLKKLFEDAISLNEIAALSVATRPDCLEDGMIGFLSELNRKKPVWVELGLQTANDEIARQINRGYPLRVFTQIYDRLKAAGLTVIVHIILGLPGEAACDMVNTAKFLASLKPELDGVKFQLLHILRGTALGDKYEKEPFKTLSLEEYAAVLCECLAVMPERTVVHRITGDGPKRILLAPKWSGEKKMVLNYLNRAIASYERS